MTDNTKAKTIPMRRLTRKQRKELGRRIWSKQPGLDVVHPDAAGIDIGSDQHYVAVGPDRDAEPVRVFGCMTEDPHRLARWLKECEIRTVVMQSTGVYWIPVYDVLEQYGFEVWLGKCAGYAESARQEKRRAREPVVAETAHLWIAEEIVSARAQHPRAADLLAGTR